MRCGCYMKKISTGWFYFLKIVAMVTMTITHTAEVLYSINPKILSVNTTLTCLLLGRLAFPIFAFLLIESFYFTKDRKKHLLSMGVLALITEPLFDMGFRNEHPLVFTAQSLNSQNVIIPLFLSFLALSIADKLQNDKNILVNTFHTESARRIVCTVLSVVALAIAPFVSHILNCDYLWHGVLLIYGFAFARKSSHPLIWQTVTLLFFMAVNVVLTGYIYLSIPFTIFFLFASQSDVKMPDWFELLARSKPLKFICRYFYPLHFLVLAIVRIAMM